MDSMLPLSTAMVSAVRVPKGRCGFGNSPNRFYSRPGDRKKPILQAHAAQITQDLNQEPGQSMRRILRKSMPFVWALLIGTLAGVLVAGFAVSATHS